MSYDVTFKEKLESTDGTDRFAYVCDAYLNYTSNMGECIEDVCGLHPADWNGMRAGELAPHLVDGITKLRGNPQKYRHYEPDNGWGSVETCASFLIDVWDECLTHPRAIVEVDY